MPYAVHRLGLSASGVGVTLAVYGVGMVVGALLAGRLIAALPFGLVVVIGPLFGLAAALVMVATIWMPVPALAGLSFFLIGVGPIVWVISTTTLRQIVAPERLFGRASAINKRISTIRAAAWPSPSAVVSSWIPLESASTRVALLSRHRKLR